MLVALCQIIWTMNPSQAPTSSSVQVILCSSPSFRRQARSTNRFWNSFEMMARDFLDASPLKTEKIASSWFSRSE